MPARAAGPGSGPSRRLAEGGPQAHANSGDRSRHPVSINGRRDQSGAKVGWRTASGRALGRRIGAGWGRRARSGS
jgi:hypothetical protein